MFESRRGTRKNGLTGDFSPFSRASYAQVWRKSGGPNLPAAKIEFVIRRDAISRCFEGFNCTLLSRSSITFSIPPTPSASLFLRKFGRNTRPIFSKSGEICTRQTAPWLRRWICCRKTAKYWTREVEQLVNVYTYFISWVSNSSNTVNHYL